MFPLSASPPEHYLVLRTSYLELLRNSLHPLFGRSKLIRTSAVFDSSTERQSLLHILADVAFFSLERRRSSRTFRYGYLVTTSPQLSDLPSAAPSYVRSPTSGISDSHGVTGGVYKTRERIHRSILICDY